MGTDASNVVSESESLWPRFRRRIKRIGKNQASMPSPFSKYAVEISPKSEGSVRIVSISRDGELIPVVLSPARKSISNDQQPSKKKKKPPGFDAASIKVKSHDAADISMKSRESEVRSDELASKQISKEEEKVGGRKSNLRSWVRSRKAFLFPAVPDLHQNSRAELKVSQGSLGGHAKDTEAPAIEQGKALEIRPENELPDLIPAPVDQASKSASMSAEVDSEGGQQLTSIGFDRKVSSHASVPNIPFKRQGSESADSLSSASSSRQFPCPDMAVMPNSPKSNSQPRKLNMSAKGKRTLTQTSTKSLGGATGECEGSVKGLNLWFVIIIMGCLVVLSNRLLAVLCTSLWWYLLPSLLGRK